MDDDAPLSKHLTSPCQTAFCHRMKMTPRGRARSDIWGSLRPAASSNLPFSAPRCVSSPLLPAAQNVERNGAEDLARNETNWYFKSAAQQNTDSRHDSRHKTQVRRFINPLEFRDNYSATSNMKLVHWSLMGGLLQLVQRGGDWAGPHPAQAPPRCTKCNSPPINGQYQSPYCCINGPLLCGFNVGIKGLILL